MKRNTVLSILLAINLMIAFFAPAPSVLAASEGLEITTTLVDNAVQKGSKKTFDVWARNSAGEKIRATVTLNGEKLSPVWEDTEKASYTLVFTKEGENTVVISASSDGGKKKQLTYHIYYQKAQEGEPIGTATWSVELFSLGNDYLIEPTQMVIYEGETAAEQLIRLLHENGFIGYYSGMVKAGFYLGYIADGDAVGQIYNGYQKSESPSNPRKLNLTPDIPSFLRPHLSRTMTFFEEDDYEKNWNGYIGEFVITNGSGWMYSVNNIFPNVGFADTYLTDGDVIRVQFTLGYGADIGGFGAMGAGNWGIDSQMSGGYYQVANKDRLTVAICQALSSGYLSRNNVKNAYENAISVITTLDASQSAVDTAAEALNAALLKPDAQVQPQQPQETEQPQQTEQSAQSQQPQQSQQTEQSEQPEQMEASRPQQSVESQEEETTKKSEEADTTEVRISETASENIDLKETASSEETGETSEPAAEASSAEYDESQLQDEQASAEESGAGEEQTETEIAATDKGEETSTLSDMDTDDKEAAAPVSEVETYKSAAWIWSVVIVFILLLISGTTWFMIKRKTGEP